MQAWKDQYIGKFISIAGAWSGGNLALEFEISGFSGLKTIIEGMVRRILGDGLRLNKWRSILLKSCDFSH